MNILYRKSEKPHNHGPAIQFLSKSSDIPLTGPTQGFFTEIAMSLSHTPAVVSRSGHFFLFGSNVSLVAYPSPTISKQIQTNAC